MESAQSFVPNYYAPRASISYQQSNAATPIPRRSNSIPQPHMPQPSGSYNGWQMQVGTIFPPYNTGTPQHQPQQPHHSSHGPRSIGGSNPSTPIANAPYTPMQMLPRPLPSIHQHQTHNALTPHHDIAGGGDRAPQYDASRIGPHMSQNVSFSEFLESAIPERSYDLGAVAPGLGDDEVVNIGGRRVQDQGPGLPGNKDMPHT